MGPEILFLSLSVWLLSDTARAGLVRLEEDQGQEDPCQSYTANDLLYIDCSDRGISELPNGLDYNAQVLLLSNNNFESFPPQLENFSQLQKLDFSGNRLSNPIPAYLQNNKYLHTLNLSNSNYEAWIGDRNVYSIRRLDLSKNKINEIDVAAISGMPNLTYLDLSENRIYSMSSKMFSSANNLETLILSRNYFSDVPNFQSTSLKRLRLNSCQITNLKNDSLAGMSSLLEIDLSINQIETIPDGFTSNTLQELDLSYNEIASLTDRTFSSLPHLAVLNLRGNEFREVWSTSHFSSNSFLREIHVKGNRWSCEGFNVNLLLTYDFLASRVNDRASLICYTPMNVTQLSWQQAYIQTWHSADTMSGSFTVLAVVVGIIIGICFTSFICRGLAAINNPTPSRPTPETTALNLNNTVLQPRVESVVLRIPLSEDLPPTYDEALLMPRLNSFHSLPDFVDEEEEDINRGYRRSRSIGDLTDHRPRVADRRSVRRTVDIHIN